MSASVLLLSIHTFVFKIDHPTAHCKTARLVQSRASLLLLHTGRVQEEKEERERDRGRAGGCRADPGPAACLQHKELSHTAWGRKKKKEKKKLLVLQRQLDYRDVAGQINTSNVLLPFVQPPSVTRPLSFPAPCLSFSTPYPSLFLLLTCGLLFSRRSMWQVQIIVQRWLPRDNVQDCLQTYL